MRHLAQNVVLVRMYPRRPSLVTRHSTRVSLPLSAMLRLPLRLGVFSSLFACLLVFAIPPAASAQDGGYGDEYEEEMMEMEMGMEDGYEDGGYGGGGRSSRGGASAQDVMASRLSDALKNAVESTSLSSLMNPEAAPPVLSGPVLLNDASVAYAKGDAKLALDLFYGHLVGEYEKASNELALIKYSRLMKRPAWQVRWGISFRVRGDATDPQPIQETSASKPTGGRGGRGGRGGFGGGDGGYDDGYGDGGMEMAMEEEMMEQGGGYDEEMMEMEMEMEMGGGSGRPRRAEAAPAAPTPAARLAALESPMLSVEAAEELDSNLGVVATIFGQEFDNRYSQGDFGRALTDVTEDGGSQEAVSEDFVDLIESSPNALPMWRPGIVYLGQGEGDSNTAIAEKAGLDLLLHFEIYLKPRGTEYTQNTARCKLIHVPSGKSLVISKPIDSIEFLQNSRNKGQGSSDYIGEKIENLLEIVDRQTVTSDMPSLTPEIAKRRIGSLLATGGARNLRTLAEVRLFQSQQLLSEDDVLKAFDIVGGEDGMTLLYGTEEERLGVVRKWAAAGSGSE